MHLIIIIVVVVVVVIIIIIIIIIIIQVHFPYLGHSLGREQSEVSLVC